VDLEEFSPTFVAKYLESPFPPDPWFPHSPIGGDRLTRTIATAARKAASAYLEAVKPERQWRDAFPVFVTSNIPAAIFAWTEWIRATLASEPDFPLPLEVIGTLKFSEQAPKALELPVRIWGVGGPEVGQTLESVQQRWYYNDPNVREFGLRVEGWSPNESELLRLNFAPDIIVSGDSHALPLTRLLAQFEKVWPRLIVFLREKGGYDFPDPYLIARGVAVADVPIRSSTDGGDNLGLFLEELVHDWPLHNAINLLRRDRFSKELDDYKSGHGEGWWRLPRVYADPVSNQSLRLSSALPAVRQAAAAVHPFAQKTDVPRFARMLGEIAGAESAEKLQTLLSRSQTAGEAYRAAELHDIEFVQEGLGLHPMAKLAAASEQLSREGGVLAQDLTESLKDPAIQNALEKIQERKVDARLFHRRPDGTAFPVVHSEALQPEAGLRLTVHIGQRADGSLVIGDVPALDPLLPPLPDEETHELEIVVFPKDFVLESQAIQTVSLSRFGGTAPVDWEIRAPRVDPNAAEDGLDCGVVREPRAELRFGVYYRNQLLQSFRLRAVIGAGEPLREERRVLIECDFSQTRRFGGLGQLNDRIASLGLNRDAGTTHTLTFKKDKQAAELSWTEGQMARFTNAVRAALRTALAPEAPNTPFPFDAKTLKLASSPPPAFPGAVDVLARAGRSLYNNLYQRHRHRLVADVLDELRGSDGEVLQIARLDPDYAFPWPLIYDFASPDLPRGLIPGVCLGRDDLGFRCHCHEDSAPQTWCLRGFWGFRFLVEQRCDGPPPLDGPPGKIADSRATPALRAVIAVKDDFVDAWIEALKGNSQPTHVVEGPPVDFLAALRTPGTRSPLVVYIGHHGDAGVPDLPAPQLELEDGTPILDLDDFTRELQLGHKDWEAAPRSLILLLACGSGTDRVDTGTSLAAALLNLGAVGVLATECTVLTGIVSRVARDLTSRLAQGQHMGAAMRETIFELAVEGCPLGLAFTYLGTADAHLPP